MNKKVKTIVLLLLAAVAIVLAVLYASSYTIALRRNGFDRKDIQQIDVGIDANGCLYHVIGSHEDGVLRLAHLTRSALGLWKVDKTAESQDSHGRCTLGWIGETVMKAYYGDGASHPSVDFEYHAVYGGADAVAVIETLDPILPPNVTVSIRQSNDVYFLHFITYGSGTLTGLHIYEEMAKLGYISAE